MHYSTSMELLFLSYECGLVMYGRPKVVNGAVTLQNPVHLDPKKISQNSQTNSKYWNDKVGYAVHWQDMGIINNKGLISYCAIKDECWIPVLLEISGKEIQLRVYKNHQKTLGLCYTSDVTSSNHIARFFVASDTGAACLYPIPGASCSGSPQETTSSTPDEIIKKHFTLDKLPTSVKMNTDVFEGCVELSAHDYDSIFAYTGDFKSQLGSAKSTINVMKPNQQPIMYFEGKSRVKLSFTMSNQSPDSPHNDIVVCGLRISLPEVEDMFELKIFNRLTKINGNHKISEIGLCDAEIMYAHMVGSDPSSDSKKSINVEFEIRTKDVDNHPINIYGVDIFGKKKDAMNYSSKQKVIQTFCEKEHLSSNDGESSDVLKELLQSADIPVLVTSKEKFESTEKLLDTIRSHKVRDERRLLFYICELCSNMVDFMTDQQIENELFYHIYPLIGQYMCQVEEISKSTTSYSKLILESLTRCLNQCWTRLGRLNEKENILYNCFIDYVKSILDNTSSSCGTNQVCSLIKVAHDFTQKSNQNVLLQTTKTTYLVTNLTRLLKNTVIYEIEVAESEKRLLSNQQKEQYTQAIDRVVSLLFSLYQYTTFTNPISHPTCQKVLHLLNPLIFSNSSMIKHVAAVKIKGLCYTSISQAASVHKSGDKSVYQTFMFSTTEVSAIKNDLKYMQKDESGDVDMQNEDDEKELEKAIEMSLEESKVEQDVPMQSLNSPLTVTIGDQNLLIELLKYVKQQILEISAKNSLNQLDVISYLFTKLVKLYNRFRSSLPHEEYDIEVNDLIIEIIHGVIVKVDSKEIFEKTPAAQICYLMVQIVNSMTNYMDKQPSQLFTKDDKFKRSSESKSKEVSPKYRMRTQMIYNLLERLSKYEARDLTNSLELSKWLQNVIEKQTDFLLAGKGSVSVAGLENTNLFKDIIMTKTDSADNLLLKIQQNEGLVKWCNIDYFSHLSNKNFDIMMYSSCLELLSNLMYFERLQNKVKFNKDIYLAKHIRKHDEDKRKISETSDIKKPKNKRKRRDRASSGSKSAM